MTDGTDDITHDRRPYPAGELVELSPLVRRFIAPYPGPFTFTGTCCYVVGRGRLTIIDPGPDDAAHASALSRALRGSARSTGRPSPETPPPAARRA